MNEIWKALAREAAIAAEHIAIGVTALGKANHVQHAYYGQAFFALSTGLERTAKLIILVDHAIKNNGKFPTNRMIRDFGHNLTKLVNRVDKISKELGLSEREHYMPTTKIHKEIIRVLSDFANNISRYYNINLITNEPIGMEDNDPYKSWLDSVINPTIEVHCTQKKMAGIQSKAQLMDLLFGKAVLIRHHSESGEKINSITEEALHGQKMEFAKPYVRMYVMQIARYLARVIRKLQNKGHTLGLDMLPYFSEFYGIYYNDDQYIKKRKTWSIYT